MLNLSLDELKQKVAKSGGINDYGNKSDDQLIKILSQPKPKISFSKKRIKKIRTKI